MTTTPDDPGRLADELLGPFLAELRAAGFHAGPAQAAAAGRVLLALSASETFPPDDALALYLAPIFCANPGQQEEFGERFRERIGRYAVRGPEIEPEPPSRGAGQTNEGEKRRWRRDALRFLSEIVENRYLVITLVLSGFILTILFNIYFSIKFNNYFILICESIIFITINLSYLISIFSHRSPTKPEERYLFRRSIPDRAERFRLSLPEPVPPPFAGPVPVAAAVGMRARYEVEDRAAFDVGATVETAVRRAAVVEPVPQRRRVEPVYLALVERVHLRDHQARFAHALLDALERRGVAVDRYEFRRDPRLCLVRGGTYAGAKTLADLLSDHSGHRLLLFCDGGALFDRAGAEPAAWSDALAGWSDRALVTMVPPAAWGRRERLLAERGLLVVPAGDEGLAELSARFRGEPLRASRFAAARRFPDDLADDPVDWLTPDPPDPERIDRTLRDLHWYLGIEGYHWLSACAVYPTLEWELTLELGVRLTDRSLASLRDDVRLAALVRLPWFRQGAMPDWLRQRLIDELPKPVVLQAGRVIESLLSQVIGVTARGDSLEVFSETPSRPSRSTRDAIRALVDAEPADSPLRDPLFEAVVIGRDAAPLAFPAPPRLRRWVEPEEQETPRAERRKSFLSTLFSNVLRGYSTSVECRFERRAGARMLIVVAETGLNASAEFLRASLLEEFSDADFAFLSVGLFAQRDFREVSRIWAELLARDLHRPDSPTYDAVTLMGLVFAGPPLRQLLLDAAANPQEAPWVRSVTRMIFFTSPNQGWDVGLIGSALRSLWILRSTVAASLWVYRSLGLFRFVISLERGSPAMVDLNVRWARDLPRHLSRIPETLEIFPDTVVDDRPMAQVAGIRNPPGVPPCETILTADRGITKPDQVELITSVLRRPLGLRASRPAPPVPARVDRIVFVLGWGRRKRGEELLVKQLVATANQYGVDALVTAIPEPSKWLGRIWPFLFAFGIASVDDVLARFMDQYAEAVTRFPGAAVSVLALNVEPGFLRKALEEYPVFGGARLLVNANDASTRNFYSTILSNYVNRFGNIAILINDPYMRASKDSLLTYMRASISNTKTLDAAVRYSLGVSAE